MRQAVVIFLSLAIAGCASKLSSDLANAEEPCQEDTFSTKAALDTCLEQHERPVWTKEEPQTLDLYERFAAERRSLANQLDSGAITTKQYDQKLADLISEMRQEVAARRAAEPKP